MMRVIFNRPWDGPADSQGTLTHYPVGVAFALDTFDAAYVVAFGYARTIGAVEDSFNDLVDAIQALIEHGRSTNVDLSYAEMRQVIEAALAST